MTPDSPSRGRAAPTRAEAWFTTLLIAALAVAIAAPPIAQDPAYHAFADQRAVLGVPRGADVVSSLAFVAVALVAIARLAERWRVRFSPATEAGLWTLASGLALTGVGSAVYHLDPRDATLAWDRLPMTIAFAGVVTAAVAQRISRRLAAIALPLLVVLGIASVLAWRTSGNLTPYVVVQFGGALAVILIAALTSRRGDPIPWWWVVGGYALAKVFEHADAALFEATGGIVAGHALKHVFAAAAGTAVFWPLFRLRRLPVVGKA